MSKHNFEPNLPHDSGNHFNGKYEFPSFSKDHEPEGSLGGHLQNS
jgi:hypothetical protein